MVVQKPKFRWQYCTTKVKNHYNHNDFFLKVYTGAYRPRDKEVARVEDTSSLSKGDLVTVICETCEVEPTIGRVEEITGTDVEIVWLEGGYERSWKAAKHRDPKNKSRMVKWRDTVPKGIHCFFLHLNSRQQST